jgi:hypothetical protein
LLRAWVRASRALARRVLAKLGWHRRPRPYRPHLSEALLLERLRAGAGESVTRSDRIDGSASFPPPLLAAYTARALLEARFFIAPTRIATLWPQLQHAGCPWHTGLLARAAADREHGIPLYAGTGPRLGAGFSWGRLPAGPGRDSLHAKRPHRFAFAPRSALASIDEPAAGVALHETLECWVAYAESARDPVCYDSNLIVIQRILALSWCWAFLAARPPRTERGGLDLELLVLRILHADTRYLEPRLGHSVPNNHLLADWFAGWYLQQVLPEFLDRPAKAYEESFRDELLRQTYPDGGSFEHSLHYHEFACEMGSAYLLLCARLGRPPDPRLRERVRTLLRFQSTVTGAECAPLPVGNAVEDTLFPLDTGEAWCAGSLREIERALFRPELAPAPQLDPSLARAYWLLGGAIAPASPVTTEPAEAAGFTDAGFHVHEDHDLDARLVFRTGPAQHVSLAAGHMHADLLSVYLSVGGRSVLIDAGTYTYRHAAVDRDPAKTIWRRYFAGPAAHNTLCIAGEDPLGAIDGDFRAQHTSARVRQHAASGRRLRWAEGEILDAGAYSGQRRGCVHVPGHYWVIYDQLPRADASDSPRWFGFQFAPGLALRTDGARTGISLPGSPMTISLVTSLAATPQLLHGSTDPPGGWFSPRYAEKLPAPQLRYPVSPGSADSAFILCTTEELARCAAARIEILCDDALMIRIPTSRGEDRLVLNRASATSLVSTADGIEFVGRLLWLRMEGGNVRAIRWLAGRSLAWKPRALHIELRSGPDDVVLGEAPHGTSPAAFRTLQYS